MKDNIFDKMSQTIIKIFVIETIGHQFLLPDPFVAGSILWRILL